MLAAQAWPTAGFCAGDVLYIYTGWEDFWQDPDMLHVYYTKGPGLSQDATFLLRDKKVVLVALDNPFTDPVAEGQLAGGPPPAGTPAGLPFVVHHQNLSVSGIHKFRTRISNRWPPITCGHRAPSSCRCSRRADRDCRCAPSRTARRTTSNVDDAARRAEAAAVVRRFGAAPPLSFRLAARELVTLAVTIVDDRHVGTAHARRQVAPQERVEALASLRIDAHRVAVAGAPVDQPPGKQVSMT